MTDTVEHLQGVIASQEAELRALTNALRVVRDVCTAVERENKWLKEAHSDHPLRHYDRTCPACNAEGLHLPQLTV